MVDLDKRHRISMVFDLKARVWAHGKSTNEIFSGVLIGDRVNKSLGDGRKDGANDERMGTSFELRPRLPFTLTNPLT